MALEEHSVLPWYRHRFVWLIVAIPSSAIVMGVVMIYLALESDDGLVADDYYKRGLEINRRLERDANATALLVSASLSINNREGVISMLFDKGKLDNYPDQLSLELLFATHERNDTMVTMLHGQNNQYIGHLKSPLPEGKWYIELGDERWRLSASTIVSSEINLEMKL